MELKEKEQKELMFGVYVDKNGDIDCKPSSNISPQAMFALIGILESTVLHYKLNSGFEFMGEEDEH